MKRSLKIVIGCIAAFIISIFLVSPAGADEIRLDVDGPCPTDYPIKQQISDARTNITYWLCITQYQWDIEMMGGETHAKWLASGKTYDATQDISNWKTEKAAIERLRLDTEALAKSEAQNNPNTQVCKAFNYTSKYNGSGGGTFCTIHTETVDVSVPEVAQPPVEASAFTALALPSANKAITQQSSASAEVTAVNKVTAKYLTTAAKSIKKMKLKKMTYTFARAPKGSEVSITKVSGDSCFVNKRSVYLGSNSECTVSVTITKKGLVQGAKVLTFIR